MQRDARSVLITGAGSGIGRALAVVAAGRGLAVHLAGRRLEKLEETQRCLPVAAESYAIKADITTPEGRRAIREGIERAGRGLDILVNNAGTIASGPLSTARDAEIAGLLDTNLAAPILLTRDLLPLLRRSACARVVNVGSVFGDIAAPDFAVYATTKFGLRGFSDALRRELAAEGIGVTYAAPRATETEGVQPIAAALKRQGNSLDDPTLVAQWIWKAIEKGRRSAYPPTAERLFVAIQRAFPALIDRALAKRQDAPPATAETAGS